MQVKRTSHLWTDKFYFRAFLFCLFIGVQAPSVYRSGPISTVGSHRINITGLLSYIFFIVRFLFYVSLIKNKVYFCFSVAFKGRHKLGTVLVCSMLNFFFVSSLAHFGLLPHGSDGLPTNENGSGTCLFSSLFFCSVKRFIMKASTPRHLTICAFVLLRIHSTRHVTSTNTVSRDVTILHETLRTVTKCYVYLRYVTLLSCDVRACDITVPCDTTIWHPRCLMSSEQI